MEIVNRLCVVLSNPYERQDNNQAIYKVWFSLLDEIVNNESEPGWIEWVRPPTVRFYDGVIIGKMEYNVLTETTIDD